MHTTPPPHRAQRAPQKRSSPPSRAANRAHGGRAGRRCLYCGATIRANSRALTCGPSCRSSLSRKKRRLADAACVSGFNWQRGEGERMIARYGLPLMEKALAVREIYWHADRLAWIDERNTDVQRRVA